MKKILFLLLCMMFIPIVYAKDVVSIEKVELDSKSDNATVKSEPVFSGLDVTYDVGFRVKDDFVKYKIVLKNNTENEYTIKEETMFSDSNHIKYTYEVPGVLGANEEIEIYLTISYIEEVEPSEIVDGVYNESNNATVRLYDEEGEQVNPKTSTSIMLFIVLIVSLVIFLGSVYLLTHKKIKSAALLMIIGLVSMPVVIKAIEELELKVNVSVEIKPGFSVVYGYNEHKIVSPDEYALFDEGEYSCKALYFGEVVESEKQYYCSHFITIEDSQLYSYGDTVTVKGFDNISLNYNRCDNTNDYLLCEVGSVYDSRNSSWVYFLNGNGVQDKEQMAIRNGNGDLEDYHVEDFSWGLGENYTFKVPSHNVEFNEPMR